MKYGTEVSCFHGLHLDCCVRMLSDAVVSQFSAVAAGDNVLTEHLFTSGIAMVPECLRSSPQESH